MDLDRGRPERGAGRLVAFDLDIPARDFVDRLGLATSAELEEMISLWDLFIPCIVGARDLTRRSDTLEMARTFKEKYRIPHVAISHGDQGCFVATEQAAFQSPAYLIEPVDGTGSGDAFHTGMIYGFLRGWDMRETAQFANACGALNTIHLGARSGMVSLEAVQQFMAATRRHL